jgi:hypothetical protein
MLLHQSVDGEYLETREPRMRDRLAMRLHGADLDVQLACGGSPEGSMALALRAKLLGRMTTRKALAGRLYGVLADAERPRVNFTSRVPVCRRKVQLARAELEALAERLRQPAPVAVEGVAMARRLITNGSGPLYTRTDADDLAVAAEQARFALDPWAHELRAL